MKTPISQPNPLYLDSLWEHLLRFLPSEEELLRQAKECRALQRLRGVKRATDLLRILLSYSACDLSLCATSAWAWANRSGHLSDVAILNRLRTAGPWLEHLILQIIAKRVQAPQLPMGLQLRLADATTMSIPGSNGADWRLHVSYDPLSPRMASVRLTTGKVGEHLSRFPVQANELWIADRGYGFRRSLAWVLEAKAHFIVRIPWNMSTFQYLDGNSFDLFGALRAIPQGGVGDFAVRTQPEPKNSVPALEVRLVAMRKRPEDAEKARKKVLKEAARRNRWVDPRTLEACDYIMVLTSLPATAMGPG